MDRVPALELAPAPETGLQALAIVAGLLHCPTDAGQLAHALGLGGRPVVADDILLGAQTLGLRAKIHRVDPQRIVNRAGEILRADG